MRQRETGGCGKKDSCSRFFVRETCRIFTGRNGRGKTTFLNLLIKKHEYSGSIVSSVVFDYFPFPVPDQERFTYEVLEGLPGSGNYLFWQLLAALFLQEGHFLLIDEPTFILVSHDRRFLDGCVDHVFRVLLRKLDFSREQFEKPMEDYSEGQKKKVLIARSLCQQAHLYIWDEPLNFIDVYSRIQIEELILKFRPTMILVEHDEVFTGHVETAAVEIRRIDEK